MCVELESLDFFSMHKPFFIIFDWISIDINDDIHNVLFLNISFQTSSAYVFRSKISDAGTFPLILSSIPFKIEKFLRLFEYWRNFSELQNLAYAMRYEREMFSRRQIYPTEYCY